MHARHTREEGRQRDRQSAASASCRRSPGHSVTHEDDDGGRKERRREGEGPLVTLAVSLASREQEKAIRRLTSLERFVTRSPSLSGARSLSFASLRLVACSSSPAVWREQASGGESRGPSVFTRSPRLLSPAFHLSFRRVDDDVLVSSVSLCPSKASSLH